MTTIELLEESLKQLKIIQLDNLRREPNHPRNKFDYTVIVPDHPLGYHEHYTNDLQVAKDSALEWARDYGKASVEDRNLETVIFSKVVNYEQKEQLQAIDLMELIEDSVEHHCKEHIMSGERAWVMIRALAIAKLQEFPIED